MFAGWARLGRPLGELWTLSPAQIEAVFRANGMVQRKGTVRDFMTMAQGLGVPIERGA